MFSKSLCLFVCDNKDYYYYYYYYIYIYKSKASKDLSKAFNINVSSVEIYTNNERLVSLDEHDYKN